MSMSGNYTLFGPELWVGIGLGIARHVAEVFRMETGLSSHLFRDVFYALDAPMAIVGLSGHPLLVNAALERIMEYSESEMRRMSFAEFTHPGDIAIDSELFEELKTGRREKYTITKRWITKRGDVLWGLLTVSAIRGDDGTIHAAVAVIHKLDHDLDVKASQKFVSQSSDNGTNGMKKENFILAALREIAAMKRPFAVVGAAALFMFAVWMFFGGGLNRIIELIAR